MRGTREAELALGTFASALAVLVLNDALLKGLGVLPGWLTGKLSDVAGLIVAPVCLAMLLSARRRSTQLCCVALIAVVFALTELSPACTRALERGLAALGLTWRLWPDLSDLLALLILPVSAWCCRALLDGAGGSAQRGARWLTVPACLACLASGGPNPFWARAYLYNATQSTALVELSSAWLGCDVLDAFDPAFLEPADFRSLGLFELPAGEVMPLEARDLGDEGNAMTLGSCMCPLLQVSTAGQTVTVLLRELSYVSLPQKPSSGERKSAQGQLLSLLEGAERLEVGAQLVRFELALPGASATQIACPAAQPPPLDVSLPPVSAIERNGREASATLIDQRVLAVRPVAGSCFEVALAPSGAAEPTASDAGPDAAAESAAPSLLLATPRLQICAPLELFPFQAGDLVQLIWFELNPNEPTRESVEIHGEAAGFRLERGRYQAGLSQWYDYELSLPALRCGPQRGADGEPFEPVDVGYAGQALVPGQVVSPPRGSGGRDFDRARERSIYLGRAERPLTRACGTDESWIEVVESWTN